ncbi:MAG: pirin family protein [Betaproteobacteria bacterium]|nr:pirin family protein [Betaproteobacteria bacterium]
MSAAAVLSIAELGFPWETSDPFLFCVYHHDAYPAGNERLGPAVSLAGRQRGQDFEGKDGWRMYHGDAVPGFPQHPHRGFETVTIVRRGYIDHSDSLGATARFGAGDTQWLTAGRGVVHSEMFPLREPNAPNPLELFQIWLNLPRAQKFAAPHFTMLWRHAVPLHAAFDGAGRRTEVTVIAGRLGEARAPACPPESWAAAPEHDVAIWTIRMASGAQWTLPPAMAGTNRRVFFFRGSGMRIGGHALTSHAGVSLRAEREVALEAGADECELLLLQGRPIAEPVAQYGPFVMNTQVEIRQAFLDYEQTRFGGWPFASNEPVHPRAQERFARHADGRVEQVGG